MLYHVIVRPVDGDKKKKLSYLIIQKINSKTLIHPVTSESLYHSNYFYCD